MSSLNYNKFRIWVGRLFGLILLVYAGEELNSYALFVIAAGFFIRIWATGYIHKDKEVTMAGPYKLLRHPLYLGNFIVGLGLTLFVNVWELTALYIPVFFIVYYKKMKLEEQCLSGAFGGKYDIYKKTTPLFIPNLTNLTVKDNIKFNCQNVILNREHLNLLGVVIIIVCFFMYQSHSGIIKNTLLLMINKV